MEKRINIGSFLKLNKTMIITTILLCLFSVIFEQVFYRYNLYVFFVSDNFITTIFSSQVSISVLSITVVTLITSSLQERYLGFSLKEILDFDEQTLGLYGFIFISLINNIIGAIFLAIGYINAGFILFIYTIIIVLFFCYKILNSIMNKNYCYESIRNHLNKVFFQNDLESINRITIIFTNRFILNFESDNFEEEEELKNFLTEISDYLISKNCEQSKKILRYIEDNYKKIFKAYCKHYGFDKSLLCFNQLLKNSYWEYIETSIYSSVTENLKFLNAIEIQKENIVGSLNKFDDINNMKNSTLEFILYQYFIGIYENEAISNMYKDSIINDFIKNLTKFNNYKNTTNNLIKEKLIYYIFVKVAVLKYDTNIYLEIITNLYRGNEYSENENFYDVLAYFLLGIYSYGFCEVELLSKEFRNQIKEYINIYKKTINNEVVVFKNLIEQYSNQILCSIGKIVLYDKYEGIFEYFSRELKVKSCVWTEVFKSDIMLFLHLIFYDYSGHDSLLDYIENWAIIHKIQQREFLVDIVGKFTIKESKEEIVCNLKPDKESLFDEFCEWLEKDPITVKSTNLYLSLLKNTFESCNKELKEIIKQEILDVADITIDTDVKEINNIIKENLNSEYGYDSELPINKEIFELQTNPKIRDKRYINHNNLVNELKIGVLEYLKNYFIKNTTAVELGFNYNGVKILLNKLKTMHNIRIKTTQFTYDLAIDGKTRSTEEYKQLVELESKLEYKTLSYMRNAYINPNFFRFNIEVTKIDKRELTDEELNMYSENFIVANGLYNIDGALMNKSEAMMLLKKHNVVINIIFKLKTTICKKSGFYLKYNYSKKSILNEATFVE